MTARLLALLALGLAVPASADAQWPPSPPLGALLAAALDQPGLSAREIEDARRRSRRSGALPRVQVRARRITEDARHAEEMNAGLRHRGSAEQALLLEAQLHFDLGRLVYGADAVALEREAREREERRHRRIREVVQVYYERERLLLEASLHLEPDPELHLRILEAEATLDALTHGAFSQLRERASTEHREHQRSGTSRAIR
ncbi:MAG: hypothetical protein GXY23_17510 [Myxococcales bacterium]|nr:hypothetical protein [Myxococcales bacterium]